jgi:phosphatidylinositol glycan class B
MLSNFWNFAYSTRTLSNNIETMLILMSLLYLPMGIKQSKPRTTLGVCLMGLSILNRPSAITHWIVPLARLLHSWTGLKSRLFIRAIISAGLVTLFGVLIDSLYYEKLTLSWWNFVQFNFFQGISEFYGTSPWHYHLVQTIPIMGNTALPLVLYAFSSKTDLAFILQFLAGSVFFNSLLPHKEFRFLSPIAPFLMLLAGLGYWMLFGNWNRRLRMALLVFIVVSNVVAGVYLTRVHQSGVIKVMDHLRTEIDNGVVKGIHFAMPCHSTPFYGYLHRNVPMTFVTCHPPVGLPKDKYLDESDIFQKEPAVHLSQAINQTISHVVIFEELLSRPNIKNSLHAFQLCWRVFNSHWNPDQRRTGDVLVYCRRQ